MKPSTDLISYFIIKSLGVRVTCTNNFKVALEQSIEGDLQDLRSTYITVDASNKDDIYDAIKMMVKYYGLTYEWNQSILELGYLDPTDCIRYNLSRFSLPLESI